jgi:hypothetical protein
MVEGGLARDLPKGGLLPLRSSFPLDPLAPFPLPPRRILLGGRGKGARGRIVMQYQSTSRVAVLLTEYTSSISSHLGVGSPPLSNPLLPSSSVRHDYSYLALKRRRDEDRTECKIRM